LSSAASDRATPSRRSRINSVAPVLTASGLRASRCIWRARIMKFRRTFVSQILGQHHHSDECPFLCTQSECTHHAKTGLKLTLCWKPLAKREIEKTAERLQLSSECQHATATEMALCLRRGTAAQVASSGMRGDYRKRQLRQRGPPRLRIPRWSGRLRGGFQGNRFHAGGGTHGGGLGGGRGFHAGRRPRPLNG
jgi:hypothetical protein